MTNKLDDSPFGGLDRTGRAAAAISGTLVELGDDRRWLIPCMANRSIAPEILKFAREPTASCSSGTARARLYLVLQGYPLLRQRAEAAEVAWKRS